MRTRGWVAVCIGVWLLAGMAVWAEDITINGVRFEDATVQPSDEGITVVHKRGVTRFFFGDLPAELRTKYGYDEARYNASINRKIAAALDRSNSEERAQLLVEARRVACAKALNVRLEIVQVSDGMALARGATFTNAVITTIEETKVPTDLQTHGLRTWHGRVQPPPRVLTEKHAVEKSVVREVPIEVFLVGLPSYYIVGSQVKGTVFWSGTRSGHESYALDADAAAAELAALECPTRLAASSAPPTLAGARASAVAVSNAPPEASLAQPFGIGLYHGVTGPLREFGVAGMEFLPIADRTDPYRFGIGAGLVVDLLILLALFATPGRGRRGER